MSNYLKFVCVFLTLLHYDVVNGLSRSYSAGGVWSNVNSNGFSIRQEPGQLFCGNLRCPGAINCEIIKHGSSVNEKCMDGNMRVIDQKSYSSSVFGDDVELYFGPAYARQAEEQSRVISDQVNDQINRAFDNAFGGFNPNYPNNNIDNVHVYRSGAVYNGKMVTYLSIFTAFSLIFLARC